MPPTLLTLPREIRDNIYIHLLLGTRPQPAPPTEKFLAYTPAGAPTPYLKVYDTHSTFRGEFGCAYADVKPPPTCASFMACCAQVRREMSEAWEWLDRRGEVCVALDCMAVDESWHYFSVLGAPRVSTRVPPRRRWWEVEMPRGVRAALGAVLPGGWFRELPRATTCIRRVRIDVRLMGTRGDKYQRPYLAAGRTAWAVCAALKRLVRSGPDFAREGDSCVEAIDEVVLNVVSPRPRADGTPARLLDEDAPADAGTWTEAARLLGENALADATVHPRTVARELVNVWARIWRRNDYQGVFYAGLLGKIGWVRVCVDGETWSVRELRGLLERGQKERQRIAERFGER